MKHIALLLMAFLVSATAWAEDYSSLFGGGTGTAADPYQISTLDHILNLSLYSQQLTTFEGVYFVMTNDIEASNPNIQGIRVWGIGGGNRQFSGVFDGQGHKLTGIALTTPMFEWIGVNGVVKNVVIDHPQMTGVKTTNNAAFLAGTVSGTVENCRIVDAVQNFTVTTWTYYNGGVAAYVTATGVVKDCIYSGTVTTAAGFGAIAGRNYGGLVRGCKSAATIVVTNSNVASGGIGGMSQWMEHGAEYNYVDCVFEGNLSIDSASPSSVSMGGIIGDGGAARIKGCVNKGTIVGLGYLGGIAGKLSGNSCVEDSYNIARVSDYFMAHGQASVSYGMSDYVAGLVGFMMGGTIDRSWNGGTLRSARSAGGLIGSTGASGGNVVVNNSYNAGLVYGPSTWLSGNTTIEQTGGLVAYQSGPYGVTMNSCLSLGTIINSTLARPANSEYIGYTQSPQLMPINHCFYDKQVAGYKSAIGGKTTAELTDGTQLSGLDNSVWEFEQGYYPRLKSTAQTDAARLCAAPYFLADGDTHAGVRNDFTVSEADGVAWSLNENASAVLSGNRVTLTQTEKVENVIISSTLGGYVHESVVTIAPNIFAGSGTESDPYRIYTYDDLKKLAAATNAGYDFDGKYLMIMNDIDCENDATFERISQQGEPFFGHLDGGGFALNNLSMNLVAQGVQNSGLFGAIGKDASVKNLTIGTGSNIGLASNCGTIAGKNFGTIENCLVLPSVISTAQAQGVVGGIVATNTETGEVIDCYVASAMTFEGSCNYVGAIAAYNIGLIDGCQYANTISAPASRYVGGIAAVNYGRVDNCVASGRIEAQSYVGGIASRCINYNSNAPDPVVSNSLVTAQIIYSTDVEHAGAVVGDNYGRFENVVFDKQVSVYENFKAEGLSGKLTREIVADGALSDKYLAVAGKYPVLAKFASQPAVVLTQNPIVLADADTRLAMSDGASAKFPSLQGLTQSLKAGSDFTFDSSSALLTYNGSQSFASAEVEQRYGDVTRLVSFSAYGNILDGAGTADDPWVIATEADWKKLSAEMANSANRNCFENKHFKVVADVIMTSAFTPIAANTQKTFRGQIHGDGHSIGNLTISGANYVGLIGNMGFGGLVENLTIAGGNITGEQYVGGFVGYMKGGSLTGVVNNATVTGSTKTYVGGIVGYAYYPAMLANLHNNGNVTNSAMYTGGVIGAIWGNSTDVFSGMTNTGDVAGGMYTGGVVGNVTYSSLENLENSGSVRGNLATTNMVGGVIGGVDACQNITNARNMGDVTGATVAVAGVIGRYWPSKNTSNALTVSGCYNAGDIMAKEGANATNVGGIIGMAEGYNVTLSQCANVGRVTNPATAIAAGTPGAGGLIGGGAPVIVDCFNAGTVSALNCAGGLLGRPFNNSSPVVISNSLNTGWVEGVAANSANVGSITGYNSSAATYTNVCYDSQMSNLAAAGKNSAEGIVARETQEIIGTTMGENWVTTAGYPLPASLAGQAAVKVASLPVVLASGDTRYNVTKSPFGIIVAQGFQWSGSNVFVVIGNEVHVVDNADKVDGDYAMTVGCDGFTHTYPMTLNCKPSWLRGDVNGDGEVSISDVTLLVNFILSDTSNERSDVNGDGEVGISDVTFLVNILLAIE
ncbi:MAG: dockerin type I repeat-containing protein [Muribaculaceae bacterium]|nr:dockerin type I repeat-containing protein [Muribaculaceae bacterium]